MAHCHNCGEQVDPNDRFCPNCRADLSGEGPPPDRGGQSGRRDRDHQSNQPAGERTQPGQQTNYQRQQRGAGSETRQPEQRGVGNDTRPEQQRAGGETRQSGQPGVGERRRGQPSQESEASLTFAFTYPIQSGWVPILIGGALSFFSFLLLPALLLAGYGYRVSRAAALGRQNPPEYDDWGGLLVDGLRFYAVVLVGGFVGLLGFIASAAVGFGLGAVTGVNALAAPIALAGFLGLFVVQHGFITAFIGTDSVTAAVTDGRAFSMLKSGYFLKAMGLFALLQIPLFILAVVSIFTLVGFIFVSAYQIMVFGAFWGYVYYNAAQRGIVPPPAGGQRPRAQTGTGQNRPAGETRY